MSLTSPRRVRGAAVAVAAAALLLSGCGGDEEPASEESATPRPDAATTSATAEAGDSGEQGEFCGTFFSLDQGAGADRVEGWATEVRDAPLPEDMPQAAQQGLDRMLTVVEESGGDPGQLQQDMMEQFRGEGQQQVAALGRYIGTACQEQMGEMMEDMPSEMPSGMPTEMPSDLPTEVPSDLATDGS